MMTSNPNRIKHLYHCFVLLLLLSYRGSGNEIPVALDDPIYQFLERQNVMQRLTGYNAALLPVTRGQVANWLSQLQPQAHEMTPLERQLLQEYLADYRMELSEDRHRDLPPERNLYYPFQDWETLKRHWREIFDRRPAQESKHLIVYEEKDDFIWGDCEALLRTETLNGQVRLVNADRWSIQGNWKNYLAFRLQAARYRRSYNPHFTEPLYEDRKVWGMYISDSLYTYDFNHTAVTFYNRWLKIGLYHQPLRIGYSREHSLLIADQAPPFPYLGLQAQVKGINFTYLHADLLNDSTHIRSLPLGIRNRSKYLALQRVDIPFLKEKVRLGYTIMVVYGDRQRELAYLTPLNFFWLTQHTLEDRDNTLMALDGRFALLPRTVIYGTLLLDELRFEELGKHWWANKHGLQGGVQHSLTLFTLPVNLILEFTAVRPWVYTHKSLTTNFTHNAFCLGFPYGGNAQLFWLHADTYCNRRLRLQLDYKQLHQGVDLNGRFYGGDVRSSYEWRDPRYEHATRWLMGPQRTSHIFRLQGSYEIFNEMFVSGDFQIERSILQGRTTTNRIFSCTWRVDI